MASTTTSLFVSTFPGLSSSISPASTSSSPTSSSAIQPSLTSSAALYLYTFLATLVLLLAVSSAIVIRSLVLRRRHQRIVEEAIRAGTWVAHQPHEHRESRRRRGLGKKPKMWETWLRKYDREGADGKCTWEEIMPVCVSHVDDNVKSVANDGSGQLPGEVEGEAGSDPSRTTRCLRPFHKRSSLSVSRIVASTGVSSSPSRAASPGVRIAVVIAMPTPPQRYARSVDELAVVELGIAELCLQDMDIPTRVERP